MDVLLGAEARAFLAVEDALEPGHAGVHVPPPNLELYRRLLHGHAAGLGGGSIRGLEGRGFGGLGSASIVFC